MDTQSRKAAVAAWKERKPAAGIYAIHCEAAGAVWVGSAPDLAAIRNRHWFALRMGSHNQPTLQAAWQAHGEAQFRLAVVEAFDDPDSAPATHAALRARVLHWAGQLGARPI